jgi:tRNA-specific 2-thiouridylase
VVRLFEQSYLAGETPNPCAVCNPLRLEALVGLADRLGISTVATGHYARLVRRGGELFLARAADREKDQSYMLWAVPPHLLARLEFPLGDVTKGQVRAAAAAAGLEVAGEPESQEVCFAVDGYRKFLDARGVLSGDGDVVDVHGAVLGRHHGQWRFTVGQRRGLGVSASEPLYVLKRRAAENEVVVGGREDLEVRAARLRDVVDRGLGGGSGLEVQFRFRSAPVAVAAVRHTSGGALEVTLADGFAGLAPGQSAVFYRDDVVVGGGVVDGGGTPRTGRPATGVADVSQADGA